MEMCAWRKGSEGVQSKGKEKHIKVGRLLRERERESERQRLIDTGIKGTGW